MEELRHQNGELLKSLLINNFACYIFKKSLHLNKILAKLEKW